MQNKDTFLNSIPPNGVSSIAINNSDIILGDANIGKIYKLNDGILKLICQTGDQLPVSNILNVSNGNFIVTIGGKMYILFDDNELQLASNVFSTLFLTNTISLGNTLAVLDLGEENITDIILIEDTNKIILSTDEGRILACDTEFVNAYLTGERVVYADITNGFGLSNSTSTDFTYALYKNIAEINEDKEIVKWKFAANASSIMVEQIIGEFIGPIINVKEDLGFWKELLWTEIKPTNTDIVISIRCANSSTALVSSPWKYSFTSTSSDINPITRQLNNISLLGQYLQVKVKVITNKINTAPIVFNVTIKYSTKQASYFFTTKFSLEKDSDPDIGLLTATITEPQNTEVKFGITDKNSSDWSDYQIINPDKLFELANKTNVQNLKAGIKFVSYDSSIPEVAEFALMVGGQLVKALNI